TRNAGQTPPSQSPRHGHVVFLPGVRFLSESSVLVFRHDVARLRRRDTRRRRESARTSGVRHRELFVRTWRDAAPWPPAGSGRRRRKRSAGGRAERAPVAIEIWRGSVSGWSD